RLKLYFACNRVSYVQLRRTGRASVDKATGCGVFIDQRPTTSRCFGGTSSCAVPNFTLLTTISQHRLVPRRVSFISLLSAPVCTLLNGRFRIFLIVMLIFFHYV